MDAFRALCAVAVLSLGFPRPAAAGNDDGVLIGNEASLTGGAVTATLNDGTSLWYNPAGLALAESASVDVTGSAFTLRWYIAPSFTTTTTGVRADGDVVEIVSVPSALTYVRPVGDDLRIGLGVFVPQLNDVSIKTNVLGDDGTNMASLRVSLTQSSSTYYVGGGIGWSATPRFRVGLSLFVSYLSVFASSQFWASEMTPTSNVFVGASSLVSVKVFGFEARLGAQWEPVDGLHLGLSVEAPDVTLVSSVDVDATTGVAADVEGEDPFLEFTPEDESSFEFDAGVSSPVRIRAGVAYAWDRGWVSLDGDIQPAYSNQELVVDREFTWNLRAGARFHLFDKVSAGAGLFTDRSPVDAQRLEFSELQADFYGLTLGIHFNRAYDLGDEEDSDAVVFSTTIGFRYAVGFGEVGGLILAPGSDDLFLDQVRDITIHEFSLLLGSALYL